VQPWIMIDERRFDDAIAVLDARAGERGLTADGATLRALALLGRGRALSAAGDIEGALSAWLLVRAETSLPLQICKELEQEIETCAVLEAARLDREHTRESVHRGIRILETAIGAVRTQRLVENLSDLYLSAGIIEGNDQSQSDAIRMPKARKHLERALELNPAHGGAQQNLAWLLMGEAIDLAKTPSRESDMIAMMRRAHALAPSEDKITSLLSRALSRRGVAIWNQGQRSAGDTLLLEALRLDPSNEQARKNL
jgi:tetratricopeptide (TPR) repeat protein